MTTELEQAIAAEVRAEAARQSLTHKEIQQRTGIEQRSFRRYFVEDARPIPFAALEAVARVLGMSVVELVRHAEQTDEPDQRSPVVRKPASLKRVPARERQPQHGD